MKDAASAPNVSLGTSGAVLSEGSSALLILLFLPFSVGMLLFGGVRIWAIGPLSLLVFLALFIFLARWRGGFAVRIPPGGWALGLFLLYAGVQGEWDGTLVWASRVKTVMLASAAASLWLWTMLAGRGHRWKRLYGTALVLIALVGAYAVVQHLRGSRMVLYLERPEGYKMRASGTYFCPNHFANMLAMGMCLALSLVLNPEAGRKMRWMSGAVFLFLGYPLILSQSRSGVLGVLAGSATLLLLAAYRRSVRMLAIALLAVPLLAGAAGWSAWQYGPHMKERVQQAVTGFQSQQDWRILAWKGTVHMIRDRPAWGFGGGSYRYMEPQYALYSWQHIATYAHEEYLQAMAEYGIVGFVLLLAFAFAALFRLLVRVQKSPRPRNAMLAAGCVSVAVCSLVHALFDFNFHIYANTQFLLMVAGVTFACLFEDGEWSARAVPRAWKGIRAVGLTLAVLLFAMMVRSGLAYGLCFPAETAYANRQDVRAEALFLRAGRIDPTYWRPWLGLGRTLLDRAIPLSPAKRLPILKEADVMYRRGLDRNPQDVDGWYGWSQVRSLLGDEDQALQCLREMVRIHPDFPYYHSRIGVQLYRMGRLEEARDVFQAVLKNGHDPVAKLHLREIARRLSKDAPRPGSG